MKTKQQVDFYLDGDCIPESEQHTLSKKDIETAIACQNGIYSFSTTNKLETWISHSLVLSEDYKTAESASFIAKESLSIKATKGLVKLWDYSMETECPGEKS